VKVFDLKEICYQRYTHFEIGLEERIIIRIKDFAALPKNWIEVLTYLSMKSNQCSLYINESQLDSELIKFWIDQGRQLIVLTDLTSEARPFVGVLWEHSGDLKLIERVQSWFSKLKIDPKNLTISLGIKGAYLPLMASTISRLRFFNIKNYLINVDGLNFDDNLIKTLDDQFRMLEMMGHTDIQVVFDLMNSNWKSWNLKTRNTFSGLEEIHVDISNKCTHSCHFCGLYSQDIIEPIKEKNGGTLPEDIKMLMSMQASPDRISELLQNLPWTARAIQFGGMGDPLLHPQAIDFIALSRKQGLFVDVLSNFEYPTTEQLDQLHELGSRSPSGLHFIINISGPNEEIYQKTRPRQGAKVFQKVVQNISYLSSKRVSDKDQRGVHFTLMCVVTKLNFFVCSQIVDLAIKVGAFAVWWKPLEVQNPWVKKYQLDRSDIPILRKELEAGLQKAIDNNIEVKDRAVVESILKKKVDDEINF